jgi:oligopeptide transport system permease protein
MAAPELALETSDSILARPPRSLWKESLARLVKNRLSLVSGIFIIMMLLVAAFAPAIAPQDFAEQDLIANNTIPEWMQFIMPEGSEIYLRYDNDFILSADHLGRDILSRAIHGSRISLVVAITAATVSLLIGTLYGMISGYLGGLADDLMMRAVDFLYAFPFLIVVILLQTYFKALSRRGGGEGLGNFLITLNNDMGGILFLFITIGLVNWIGMARIARGQVLALKEKEFIEAARAVGASDTRIILRHLLPNILGPLIVVETLAIPGYIFLEAFLSFIGLGVNAPTPSWGIMISEAVPGIRSYPNQVIIPAIALSLTTLAFNFLGDGLRDAFDPRMQGEV